MSMGHLDDDDRLSDREFDTGVRSSPLGSFVPEGTYRPIPIVWFTTAWIVHSFGIGILFLILMNMSAILTWASTALLSFWVVHWTFARGMRNAGLGWQIATLLTLFVNWSFIALAAGAR